MAVRGGRPPGGSRDRNWTAQKLAHGKAVSGWIAGDTVGITCHPGTPSRPCIKAYCGRSADCPQCEVGRPVDWMGLVPFYREDDDFRCVARVRTDMYDAVNKLCRHDYVTFSRTAEQSIGWQVIKRPKQIAYDCRIPTRMASADISAWAVKYVKVVGVLTAEQLLAGPIDTMADAVMIRPEVVSDAIIDTVGRESVAPIVGGLAHRFAEQVGLSGDGTPFTERNEKGAVVVRPPHRNGTKK